MTTVGVPTRTPPRTVRVKSSLERILTDCGSTRFHPPPASAESDGQTGATLAPTGGQYGPTGAGPHPVAETMGTGTAPVARLEGALGHGWFSDIRS